MKERYLIKFLLRDNAAPCTGSEENWDIECALMVRDIADMASPCRNILLSLNMQLHTEADEYPSDENSEEEMHALLGSFLQMKE